MSYFVSTDWLAAHLDDPEIQIVDGSWHMPNSGRDAREDYRISHIPGAIFFDIDAIAETSTDLPHMLPSPGTFGAMVGDLGLSSDTTIVIYDEPGLFSAPRVWWTLSVMGARDVKILEGGGAKWRAESRPLESGESTANPRAFAAKLRPGAVARFEDVLEASRSGGQILDARAAPRFAGEAAEPRPGLASGHIPSSGNLPFNELIADGKLKSNAEIEAAIRQAGIDPEKPVITSCGSGVTAAVLTLALNTIGARQVALYDGSWSEWGSRPDAPVETGPTRSGGR